MARRLCGFLSVMFMLASLLAVYFGTECGRKVDVVDGPGGYSYLEITKTGNPWSPWLFWGGLVGLLGGGMLGVTIEDAWNKRSQRKRDKEYHGSGEAK